MRNSHSLIVSDAYLLSNPWCIFQGFVKDLTNYKGMQMHEVRVERNKKCPPLEDPWPRHLSRLHSLRSLRLSRCLGQGSSRGGAFSIPHSSTIVHLPMLLQGPFYRVSQKNWRFWFAHSEVISCSNLASNTIIWWEIEGLFDIYMQLNVV